MERKDTTLTLTKDLIEKLDAAAERQMTCRSAIARQLLARAFERMTSDDIFATK